MWDIDQFKGGVHERIWHKLERCQQAIDERKQRDSRGEYLYYKCEFLLKRVILKE